MTDAAVLDGLYIHERNEHGCGTRVLKLTVDGEEQTWVAADDFMAVQKERDVLRREAALINAMVCAAKPDREIREYVVRAMGRLGFTPADGAAMLDLIRWAKSQPANPDTTKGGQDGCR